MSGVRELVSWRFRDSQNPKEPGRNPKEPAGTRRNPQEPAGTRRNLQEPAGLTTERAESRARRESHGSGWELLLSGRNDGAPEADHHLFPRLVAPSDVLSRIGVVLVLGELS